jgi:PleD family two-component response regulator
MKAKFLIVDDSSVSRRIAQGYLEAAGHELTEASDDMPALDQYILDKPIRREELSTAVNSSLEGSNQ